MACSSGAQSPPQSASRVAEPRVPFVEEVGSEMRRAVVGSYSTKKNGEESESLTERMGRVVGRTRR
jgi:hypothetical protein